MLKKYILFGVTALSVLSVRSQTRDTTFKKETVNKTEIEILYSHYLQDGNHSAVTGGRGTEKLTVYAPGFRIKRSIKNHSFSIKAGVDVISSASTDNIDYVVSSASRLDARLYMNTDLSYELKNNVVLSAGTGISAESDYTSIPVNAGVSRTSKNKLRSWSVELQAIFDDLTYGRLKKNFVKPYYLVYPSELRFREWYDDHLRRSFNVKFGFTQVINKKMIVGVFPAFTFQKGLLATPFHRVYFSDNSLRPENLPNNRSKIMLGFKANNYFEKFIVRNTLDLYSDNFGVRGIGIESEFPFSVDHTITLSPSFRFYHQESSRYFQSYGMHDITENYYTSDHDLSGFNSYKIGMGFRYNPNKKLGRKYLFNELNLRYALYQQDNELKAHIITFVFMIDKSYRKRFIIE